jgi:glucose-1-phosphatase
LRTAGRENLRHEAAPCPIGRAPFNEFSIRRVAAMNPPLLSPGAADALLFDLGRVVLDLDFNRTLRCWAAYAGCDPSHLVQRFDRDEAYRRHEKGEISDAAFFASLRNSLGVDLSDAEFLAGWNAIFTGMMPGIDRLLARAARRLPLYAFSNTNKAHAEYFSSEYAQALAHFRKMFLSSSIGLRKPDAEAYDHVVDAIGVPAQRIVFFDDLAENIVAARKRGLIAIHVTSPGEVAKSLEALGI